MKVEMEIIILSIIMILKYITKIMNCCRKILLILELEKVFFYELLTQVIQKTLKICMK